MVDAQTAVTSRRSVAEAVQAYTGALALVAVSTLIGLWIAPRWGTAAVDMVYLPSVLAVAALWGLGPGLFAGIAAVLAYNFFFTEPVHTFRIDRVTDIVTVVVLLIVALVTSRLAAGIRTQARLAAAHAARNATIAGFAGRLLSSSGEEEIGATACAELSRLFDCNAMLVSGLPQPGMIAAVPEGNRLTPADVAAAALTIESGEPAGRGTARSQPAEWVFYPVRSGDRTLAAAGLARDDGMRPVDEDQEPLLANLLDQLALALERARLERESRDFARIREEDRLRSVLLESIGNDLTPGLSALTSAAREQRRAGSSDREFVSAVETEASRLQRYVSNLVGLGPDSDRKPIEAGSISIDLLHRIVRRDGEQVHLTPKEYAVLAELAKHPGQVLSHAHLLRTAWGPAQENQTEYLRVAVRALRQKLERDPSRPELIINEPAVGYRLVSGAEMARAVQ
jgi:two-component system, OmpR family, sensor histidine kinase KdpD